MTDHQAYAENQYPHLRQATAAFEARLRGQLIRPQDPDYEAARRVYNGMIDRRPRLIARCVDVADVVAAVNFARDNELPLAIRGGGHNVAGFGTCDDGLVIDLGPMKGIWVDSGRRRALVQAGCTWGDVDHATHAFGLATPGGLVSTTGVAGLTLGGGIGHLSRKHGLACDNLLAAQVVTADGRILTASRSENADLFWGLRGGGGNFGVVTSFEFELHSVSVVLGGPIFYALDQCDSALRFYRDFMADAPEELGAFFAFLIVPPGPPFPEHLHNQTVCGIICCYAGSLEEGEEVVKPLLEFGPPLFQHVDRVPYPLLQSAFDPIVPSGLHHYWKADFMPELSDNAIAAHVKHGPGIPTVQSTLHIYPTDCAVQRVPAQESAYCHRQARFVHMIAVASPDPEQMPAGIEWTRGYWNALHPHSTGGSYVNFLMDEGDDSVRATYGENYARLVALKNKYDPTNLFRLNQNIKPTM
ncbi:MAG: FAD-binding oxidoreductase [Caldilineae bacterium]|nr:FAD-binding oxidoreductase [Anaerolineae bacterium]MCB9154809.1 FAD-binding oxidoreductase [Caldilineae bacterium]